MINTAFQGSISLSTSTFVPRLNDFSSCPTRPRITVSRRPNIFATQNRLKTTTEPKNFIHKVGATDTLKTPKLSIDNELFQNTTVILTGATWFLGSAILCSLLDKTKSDVVLLYRGQERCTSKEGVHNFLHDAPVFKPLKEKAMADVEERIEVVSVDFSHADVNLEADEWTRAIDWIKGKKKQVSVIHCGARVKFELSFVNGYVLS